MRAVLRVKHYSLRPAAQFRSAMTTAHRSLEPSSRMSHPRLPFLAVCGIGGPKVTLDGAAVQIATGFAMQAPLKHAGLFPKPSTTFFFSFNST